MTKRTGFRCSPVPPTFLRRPPPCENGVYCPYAFSHGSQDNNEKRPEIETKADLLKALWAIVKRQQKAGCRMDEETDHSEADALLLEYIDSESISEAFEDIKKWYA